MTHRTTLPRPCSRLLLLGLFVLTSASAQEATSGSMDSTAVSAQKDLQQSLAELSALRQRIAAEKLPLTRRLRELEDRLVRVRKEYDDAGRRLDTRSLDLSNLQAQLAAHREQNGYLSSLLDEYVRNFETRVHVTELQRYREELDRAHIAAEAAEQHPAEFYRSQATLVETSADRLLDVLGGTMFDGVAVGENGLVKDVTFTLVGPVALFRAKDGSEAGLAEQRLGSLEPNMIRLDRPELTAAVAAVVQSGKGSMPFDPSLGNAQKIKATHESLREHILKGGPVMIPILLLALAALIVALGKWIQISLTHAPSNKQLDAIFADLRKQEIGGAHAKAQVLCGPTGEMLAAGLERIAEPKVLVEEVMFEKMLETRLRLQSLLPFVAVAAAASPLLGLLGTVTGMINTFKLITVFGTGDAKTLSSGISEALITTEFGLIVAIPSLLLHAYLSRKARRIVDGMEKAAVSMLNRVPSTPAPVTVTADDVAQRVFELLALRREASDERGDGQREHRKMARPGMPLARAEQAGH